MGVLCSSISIGHAGDLFARDRWRTLPIRIRVVPLERPHAKLTPNDSLLHLGVVDAQLCPFRQQVTADIDGGGLASVPCVLLERESQDRQTLILDSVKHS